MRSTSSHFLLCCCLLLGLLWSPGASADVLLTAKSVTVPGAHLQGVSLRLGEDAGGGLHLQLRADRADVPAMGWRRVGLALEGSLRRDARLSWLLDGNVRLAGAAGGAYSDAQVTLVVSESANTLLVDLVQGKSRTSAALPLDQPTHAQITVENLPAGWLQGLLGTVWSGRTTGGRVSADMALDVRDAGLQSSGTFGLTKLGFDTPEGTLAGEGLSGTGRFTLDTTGGPARIDLDASLRGGEVLLGPLYASLPDHVVQLALQAKANNGAIELNQLRLNDADALRLDGALAFAADGSLQTLQLKSLQATFPAAYDRYGKAWLSTLGLRDMRVKGQLNARLDLGSKGLRSFSFDTTGLDLADADGRLAVAGLHGGLDWANDGVQPATTLGWQGLQFYRVALGSAQAPWRSRDGTLALQRALDIALFDGHLHVSQIDWRPAQSKGQRLAASLALTGVDMSSFSQAMGWPAFPGTLAGAIPSLRLIDDRFVLDGGLSANLFGGFVDVTRLSLQQPFGSNPVFSADVTMKQLDLAAITSVFDFGTITGPLDGSIQDLRLVNWNPVAFSASLLASEGGRISQRAVNNLTSVGGGGIAAGLQGAVLKLFKTFGYSRIGLTCTLQGSVCQMGGVANTDDGYTIVEGSGLPRLQVIGHQTRVDWPTLVRRLNDAIHGETPEIH